MIYLLYLRILMLSHMQYRMNMHHSRRLRISLTVGSPVILSEFL